MQALDVLIRQGALCVTSEEDLVGHMTANGSHGPLAA